MRLRNARNLDARQSSLVDSAYFAVKARGAALPCLPPPPRVAVRARVQG